MKINFIKNENFFKKGKKTLAFFFLICYND